jgi:hypothetical protein
MKYEKFVSLFGAIFAILTSGINFYNDEFSISFVWSIVSIWAMATFFCELNLERKEKEIQSLNSKLEKIESDSVKIDIDTLQELSTKIPNDMDFGYTVRKFLESKKN